MKQSGRERYLSISISVKSVAQLQKRTMRDSRKRPWSEPAFSLSFFYFEGRWSLGLDRVKSFNRQTHHI